MTSNHTVQFLVSPLPPCPPLKNSRWFQGRDLGFISSSRSWAQNALLVRKCTLGAFLALEEWCRAKPPRLSIEGHGQGGGKFSSYRMSDQLLLPGKPIPSTSPERPSSMCRTQHWPIATALRGCVSPRLAALLPSTWLIATPPRNVGLPSPDTVVLSFKYATNLLTLLSSLSPSTSQPASFSSWRSPAQ